MMFFRKKYVDGKKITGQLYIIQIIVTMLVLISKELFSFYNSCSVIFYLVLSLICVFKERFVNKKLVQFITVDIMYVGLITLLNQQAGIGNFVLMIVSLLVLCNMNSVQFPVRYVYVLRIIGLMFFLFMVYVSFLIRANYSYYAVNFINPNSWAEFIMLLSMLLSIIILPKRKYHISNILILLLSIISMYNCRTRVMTIVAILYFILYCIPYRYLHGKKLMFLSVTIVFLGTIFPFVYLYLYNSGFHLMIYGKDFFSGREQIWGEVILNLNKSPWRFLFGNGSNVKIGLSENLNVHNVYLSLINNIGLLGYFSYLGLILHIINYNCKNMQNESTQKAIIMFILSNLFLGISETSLLWSSTFCLSYIGLGFSNKCNQLFSEIPKMKSGKITKKLESRYEIERL